MDLRRTRRRRYARLGWVLAATGLAAAALAVWSWDLGTRGLDVERSSLWLGTAEVGPFVVSVKGAGILVPESIRWLTAETSGRVEAVLEKPGARMEADTVVVRLENLDLRLLAVQAERDLSSGRLALLALERTMHEDRLDSESQAAALQAAVTSATQRAHVLEQGKGTFASLLDAAEVNAEADGLTRQLELARRRLDLLRQSTPAELQAQRAQVQRLREVSQVRREQLERLDVRAGQAGRLQDVLVEPGEWAVPGTPLAKIIVSERLKAKLKVPEAQSSGLRPGLVAQVSITDGGTPARGVVERVAPAAESGSVEVEVTFAGKLPAGARPDQAVHGFVELERVGRALHLPRPVGVPEHGTARLFVVDPSARTASVRQVATGRAAVDRIEIRAGLVAGEEVVLSDTSRYAEVSQLRLR